MVRATILFWTLALGGCGSDFSRTNLGEIDLCIPTPYLKSASTYMSDIRGLDQSYDELWVVIPADEVLSLVPSYKPSTYPIDGERGFMGLSVLAANDSAISGLSQAQERLLEVAKTGAEYNEVPGSNLFRINHYEESQFWSLVRWQVTNRYPESTEELHKWIAAYCGTRLNDDLSNCSAQRIYDGISYEFSFSDNNISNLENLESLVEKKLSEWRSACETANT